MAILSAHQQNLLQYYLEPTNELVDIEMKYEVLLPYYYQKDNIVPMYKHSKAHLPPPLTNNYVKC